MNIDEIASAIEADAGEGIPGLRDSLAEMEKDERARTHTPEQLAVREARKKLGLTQEAFARLIETPVGTVRDWEQGRFAPPGCALFLARLAVEQTEVIRGYCSSSNPAG